MHMPVTTCNTADMTNVAERDPKAIALGRRIREARLRVHKTQDEVAESLHVNRSNIAQYENGFRLPDVGKLQQIAAVLGVTRAELLGDMPLPLTQLEQAAALAERILGTQRGVPVPFAGRVPADTVRWVEIEEAGLTVSVPREWVEVARAPLFAVQASGDCLLADGIRHADIVILERTPSQSVARPGSIVLIRVEG